MGNGNGYSASRQGAKPRRTAGWMGNGNTASRKAARRQGRRRIGQRQRLRRLSPRRQAAKDGEGLGNGNGYGASRQGAKPRRTAKDWATATANSMARVGRGGRPGNPFVAGGPQPRQGRMPVATGASPWRDEARHPVVFLRAPAGRVGYRSLGSAAPLQSPLRGSASKRGWGDALVPRARAAGHLAGVPPGRNGNGRTHGEIPRLRSG